MEQESALALRDEVRADIAGGLDPVKLARVYLPRMEKAIELAKSPQEINEIRSQIETVATYIRRSIPKANRDRFGQFQYTHEADRLYLEASKKAGELWKKCEDKATQGSGMAKRSQNFGNVINWHDAGFKNDQDPTDCSRMAELDDEDWRTYIEYTRNEVKQPTINGAVNVWRILNNPPAPPTKLSHPVYITAVYIKLNELTEALQTMELEMSKGETPRRSAEFIIYQLTEAQKRMEISKRVAGELY